MLTILLNHWVTYVFLAWVALLIFANLWLRMRLRSETRPERIISKSQSGVQPPA